MTRENSIVDAMSAWFCARMRECCRCIDCGENVSPWDEVCSTCGRGKPAKVSAAAGFYLIVAFGILLLLVAVGCWLF